MPEALLKSFVNHQVIPNAIAESDPKLAAQLQPVCNALKCKLQLKKQLPAADAAVAHVNEFNDGGV